MFAEPVRVQADSRPTGTLQGTPTDSALSVFPDSVDQMQGKLQSEIADLQRQCKNLDERISRTKGTIHGLATMFGDSSMNDDAAKFLKTAAKRRRGLTRACRTTLQTLTRPCDAKELAGLIAETDPTLLRHHKNSSASVTTILNRLAKAGMVRVIATGFGRSRWEWIADVRSEIR